MTEAMALLKSGSELMMAIDGTVDGILKPLTGDELRMRRSTSAGIGESQDLYKREKKYVVDMVDKLSNSVHHNIKKNMLAMSCMDENNQ